MGLISTAILIPLAKGFAGTLGGTFLLGGGGYIVYKKFIIDYPLTDFLAEVSEQKFSKKSLVSCTTKGNGVSEYRYKIPTGYSVIDIEKLRPAIEDKFDCEIQVSAEEKNFVIEMSVNPIPRKLVFNSEKISGVLSEYECAMYLGKSRTGEVVIDFTNNATPHLLFGGPTGGGKSNLLNQGICGMIEAYTPEQVNFYLIDLKDGVELSPYQNVAHVRGFYETFAQVEVGLGSILLELKRRNGLFKKLGVKKLSEYNSISDEKLPRLVIVADEFAQFNNIADKELKKSIYGKWEEVLQKGRSTGIHVVVGTQVADADVFPKQIKGNIDARFGFKFTDTQHSKMISGGSELTNLPNIQGRGLYKLGTKLMQTQTPKLETKDFHFILDKHYIERLEVEEDGNEVDQKAMDHNEIKSGEEPIKENEIISEPTGIEALFLDEETFANKNPATA